MIIGTLDSALCWMLRPLGIEYAVTWNSRSSWHLETTGSDSTVWIGRLEVVVSRVKRRAAVLEG